MTKNRVVWEGWTVQDFINHLDVELDMIQNGKSWQNRFTTKEEIKKWCMDNQPYYKKHIPEVVDFFTKKYLN